MSSFFALLGSIALIAAIYFFFVRKKSPLNKKRMWQSIGAWLVLALLSGMTMTPAERAELEAEQAAEERQQQEATERAEASRAATEAKMEADKAAAEQERVEKEAEANKLVNQSPSFIAAACQDSITKKLKAPTTAEFHDDSDPIWLPDENAWSWLSHVDSENSFGAMLRARYGCVVSGTTVDDAKIITTFVEE